MYEIDPRDGEGRAGSPKSCFTGGCHGNTQGVASLVRGMDAGEAVRRLKGIDCRGKGTSCPDQLARAIEMLAGK